MYEYAQRPSRKGSGSPQDKFKKLKIYLRKMIKFSEFRQTSCLAVQGPPIFEKMFKVKINFVFEVRETTHPISKKKF